MISRTFAGRTQSGSFRRAAFHNDRHPEDRSDEGSACQKADPSSSESQAMIDVNTLVGPYPFRHVPHPDPEILDRVVQRDGLEGAWVGHLPSAFHRDPSQGNEELFRVLEKLPKLSPVPTIRPDWPNWSESLTQAKAKGAVAIRAYPQ